MLHHIGGINDLIALAAFITWNISDDNQAFSKIAYAGRDRFLSHSSTGRTFHLEYSFLLSSLYQRVLGESRQNKNALIPLLEIFAEICQTLWEIRSICGIVNLAGKSCL
jgi:hypothetical protein